MIIDKSLVGISLSLLFSSFVDARPVRGVYEVPVTNKELVEYASYPLKYESDEYGNFPKKMEFRLPAVLVGEETVVTMEKSDQSSDVWGGPNVNGECKKQGRYFICNVKFNGLKIDAQNALTAIKATYPTTNEIEGRFAVAQFFEGEPIGIIRYRLRGRDRSVK